MGIFHNVLANIFWYPINFQGKIISKIAFIQIELKVILFKFYAIQYDHIDLFRFKIQSSTSFELSNTERKSGEFGARNLTDAI